MIAEMLEKQKKDTEREAATVVALTTAIVPKISDKLIIPGLCWTWTSFYRMARRVHGSPRASSCALGFVGDLKVK